MAESSIEISAAPDWLSKLESRREILSKSKIGHESGAGAPCNVCGGDCPGLDLHFWRKLCRNCKCRKDQHDIPNEDLSGWAQFEILGAIRSKPAFLKIEVLENEAVHLDWIPPNVDTEIAIDYMNQIGKEQIPITGSAAAVRRKQQLEYQVPPHDLDHTLCHNLSDPEKILFEEHIAKIMSNAGQGHVTRLGINKATTTVIDVTKSRPHTGNTSSAINIPSRNKQFYDNSNHIQIQELFDESRKPIVESINRDKILSQILNSEIVQGIRNDPSLIKGMKLKTVDNLGNKCIPLTQDFMDNPYLSTIAKQKLLPMEINSQAIQSAVLHGWCYDKLFQDLDHFKIDYLDDVLLKPIKTFRAEYVNDAQFKNEMDNFAVHSESELLPLSYIEKESNNLANKNETYDERPNDSYSNKKIPSASSEICNNPPTVNYSTFPTNSITNELGYRSYGDLQQYPHSYVTGILETFKPSKLLEPVELNSCIGNISENILTHEIGDLCLSSNFVEHSSDTKCQQCRIHIRAGEVTVQTEKSSKNVAWHPKCFVCHTCGELLADLVYFCHKDKIYCARDFAAKLRIPRCKACDELIFTQEYTAAEGANFHIRHFCCFHCDIPLADQNYVLDGMTGQPLCLSCYENFQAEICQVCHRPISAIEQGVAWETTHWHAGCFNCAGVNCRKSLLGDRFMVKNNSPFCSAVCVKSLQL